MMARAPRRDLLPLWAGTLCLVLAGVVAAEIYFAPALERTADPVAPPAPRTAIISPDVNMPPASAFAEIVERPLFLASRRPPPPETVADPRKPPPRKLQIALAGIVISSTERFAIVQHGNAAKPLRIEVGQEIDGWRVDAIMPDRIVLRQDEVVEEVKLLDRAPPQAAAPRQPAPARPANAEAPASGK